MASSLHPLAPDPLPWFATSSAGVDYLTIGVGIFLVAFVLAIGLLYLHLHALPDHIAHKSQKVQYEIVCVLGLLAMFTHVNAFWIAGLLLALIDIPDMGTPFRRMAEALEKIANNLRGPSPVIDVVEDRGRENVVLLRSSSEPASGERDRKNRHIVSGDL